jgi:hypothetical protein
MTRNAAQAARLIRGQGECQVDGAHDPMLTFLEYYPWSFLMEPGEGKAVVNPD